MRGGLEAALVLALVGAACFDPRLASCGVACTEGQACPAGLLCVGQMCVAEGVSCSNDAPATLGDGALPSVDGRGGDAVMVEDDAARPIPDAGACEPPTGCTGASPLACDATRCQFLCGNALGWTAAESVCAGWGGHLVTIEDATEGACLGAAAGAGRLWIGYRQLPGSPEPGGGWSWVSGIVNPYRGWAGGQPNDGGDGGGGTSPGQDCAFVESPAVWFDHECAVTFRYVCER